MLPDVEGVLGAKHPETLNDRANLAHWIGEAGKPVEALNRFAELLPIAEDELGAYHPVTLRARASFARWTGETGDPAAAHAEFGKLLPDMEERLGRGHPDVRTAERWAAHVPSRRPRPRV